MCKEVLKNHSCRVRWQIKCCSFQWSQPHLSFKPLCQRTICLDIGALKDALMLITIELFLPCIFSSTHPTSLSSRGAQHSIGNWFQTKLKHLRPKENLGKTSSNTSKKGEACPTIVLLWVEGAHFSAITPLIRSFPRALLRQIECPIGWRKFNDKMMRRHEGGRDFDPLAPLKMLLPTCLQALSEWKVGIFTKDNLCQPSAF